MLKLYDSHARSTMDRYVIWCYEYTDLLILIQNYSKLLIYVIRMKENIISYYWYISLNNEMCIIICVCIILGTYLRISENLVETQENDNATLSPTCIYQWNIYFCTFSSSWNFPNNVHPIFLQSDYYFSIILYLIFSQRSYSSCPMFVAFVFVHILQFLYDVEPFL